MRHQDLYVISPNTVLRTALQKIDPELCRSVMSRCIWTAVYWDKGMMRCEDKTVLAKLMFLISRLDMLQVAEAIQIAVGRNIELSERFFNQYWIFERPQLECTVEGTLSKIGS